MNILRKKDGFDGQKSIVVPRFIIKSVCEGHPIIAQVYITDIGFYPNATHHYRQRSRGTKEHILIYCISGRGICVLNGRTYKISAGMIILLPKDKPHEYHAENENPWSIYWVHFRGKISDHMITMILDRIGSPCASIAYQESRVRLFNEMYSNLERGYSYANLCYSAQTLQYFISSCCFDDNYNFSEKSIQQNITNSCIAFMQENLHRMLSLDEIAGHVNLSVSHISAQFKKNAGFSLIEYFIQLKIQRACQYLQFTDLRINEIALKLGIEDPYYFSRMFTKVIGMSPGKYRKERHT